MHTKYTRHKIVALLKATNNNIELKNTTVTSFSEKLLTEFYKELLLDDSISTVTLHFTKGPIQGYIGNLFFF